VTTQTPRKRSKANPNITIAKRIKNQLTCFLILTIGGEMARNQKVGIILVWGECEINSKGCRGSARDKDQDQEVLNFQDLNTEGEESIVHREAEGAGLPFELKWRKLKILPEEKRLVNEYINKYGFDAFDFAFREGVKYNKMSLADIDSI
jgi:hypothetical protein